MAIALIIGRIIVGLYYIYSAAGHFVQLKGRAAYAGSKGVPAPALAVLGSGVLLLGGGLSILTGFWPHVGIGLIMLFFVGVTPVMHDFWNVKDPQERMGQMINFTKNLGLLGSTLMFVAIPVPWPISVG
jgi:putative oxidoreductase